MPAGITKFLESLPDTDQVDVQSVTTDDSTQYTYVQGAIFSAVYGFISFNLGEPPTTENVEPEPEDPPCGGRCPAHSKNRWSKAECRT